MVSLARLLLACCGLITAAAAAQTVTTLKVHHFLPTGSTTHAKLIVPWCAKIEAESAGRMKCQIFPSMQLGGTAPQLYDQVRDGVADIVWTLPGYNAGRFLSMEVFELPFMISDAQSASRAAWQYYEKHGRSEFRDVRPLAVHVHDAGYLHTRERPVRTLEDFRGMKLRAPTRQTNKLLAALGAAPVSMPVTGLADAMSKGVIDGALVPWEVVPAVKVHEVARFHTETDPNMPALYTAVFLFAMNPKTYASLPPDLRAVIDRNSGAESVGAGRPTLGRAEGAGAQAGARSRQYDRRGPGRGTGAMAAGGAVRDHRLAGGPQAPADRRRRVARRRPRTARAAGGPRGEHSARAVCAVAMQRTLHSAAKLSALAGGLLLLLIAAMTAVSVGGRWLGAMPVPGDVELVQLGTASALALFLPYCQLHGSHLVVDIFLARAPTSVQRWLERPARWLAAAVLGLLSLRAAAGLVDLHSAGETSMVLGLPLWIAYGPLPPALLLAACIAAFDVQPQERA